MSELNIFFHAIQTAFNTAVQTAVEQATAPLVQRIAALENNPATWGPWCEGRLAGESHGVCARKRRAVKRARSVRCL